MRRIDRAILVEGYFDAIAIDYAGVPGVIASMGTSLTVGQASLVRRFTSKVVIAYDGDDAGRNATLRAAQVLLSAGISVSALDLQGEKDPDTLIQRQGADRFLEVLGNATDIFDFALREWAVDVGKMGGREKSEKVENFVPLLSAVSDPVVRNDAAQRIADAFRLEFETVWSRVKGRAAQPSGREGMQTRQVAPGATAEKTLLTVALQGRLPDRLTTRLREELFEEPGCKTIFSIIKTDVLEGKPIDFAAIATQIRGEAELNLLSELTLSEDIDDRTLENLDENLLPLERRSLDRRRQEIQREIVDAERNGDGGRVDRLAAEKLEISRILNTLK
jgi:DNA primase